MSESESVCMCVCVCVRVHVCMRAQERWENFFFQGQLSVLTPILVSFSPLCYHSSKQKIPIILPKVQVAGYR